MALKPTPPPAGVGPADLFRKLLEFPRPVTSIEFRFNGAEDEPLFVRALSATEKRSCSGHGWQHRLIGLALCDANGKPVFDSPAVAGEVLSSEKEVSLAASDVLSALSTISPQYGSVDTKAWMQTLERGAAESGHVAFALGSCVDVAGTMTSMHRTPRPDRYFGCPARDLLDGHWMCWFAARRTLDKLSK